MGVNEISSGLCINVASNMVQVELAMRMDVYSYWHVAGQHEIRNFQTDFLGQK